MKADLVMSAATAASDRELVSAVRAGDDAAFEVLFRRYHPRIAGYVRGMVGDHGRAEDVTQEVFISALRRIRATDAEISFRPWIFEIAKNASIDLYRRTSRAEEVSMDASTGLNAGDHLRLVGSGPAPDVAAIHRERLDQLSGAFGELSDTHHRILVMRELEGRSYREIGERMDLTRPAVESALFRARRRLEEEYTELDSGARCESVTAAIARLAEGLTSTRDLRRVTRHTRRCRSCRLRAHDLGVGAPTRGRVAALLPLPAILRRRGGSGAEGAAPAAAHANVGAVQQAVAALLPAAAQTSTAGWGRVAALLSAAAIAAGGAIAVDRVVPDAPSPGPSGVAGPLGANGGTQPAGSGFVLPERQPDPSSGPSATVAPGAGPEGDAGRSDDAAGRGDGPGAGGPSTPSIPDASLDVPQASAPSAPSAPAIPSASAPGAPEVGRPDVPKAPEIANPDVPSAPEVGRPEQPAAPDVAPPAVPSAPDVSPPADTGAAQEAVATIVPAIEDASAAGPRALQALFGEAVGRAGGFTLPAREPDALSSPGASTAPEAVGGHAETVSDRADEARDGLPEAEAPDPSNPIPRAVGDQTPAPPSAPSPGAQSAPELQAPPAPEVKRPERPQVERPSAGRPEVGRPEAKGPDIPKVPAVSAPKAPEVSGPKAPPVSAPKLPDAPSVPSLPAGSSGLPAL